VPDVRAARSGRQRRCDVKCTASAVSGRHVQPTLEQPFSTGCFKRPARSSVRLSSAPGPGPVPQAAHSTSFVLTAWPSCRGQLSRGERIGGGPSPHVQLTDLEQPTGNLRVAPVTPHPAFHPHSARSAACRAAPLPAPITSAAANPPPVAPPSRSKLAPNCRSVPRVLIRFMDVRTSLEKRNQSPSLIDRIWLPFAANRRQFAGHAVHRAMPLRRAVQSLLAIAARLFPFCHRRARGRVSPSDERA
jgi:hypothetical protein